MKTLIIVDVQNDFCPGGSLAVTDGDKIIPYINKISTGYELIIITKDNHPPKMDAFASSHEDKKPFDHYINSDGNEDVLWPDHCVQNTHGNLLHDDLELGDGRNIVVFLKGQTEFSHPYSGFAGTAKIWDDIIGLDDYLDSKGVHEIDIVGLALDFCVKETALDGVKNGYKTNVLLNGCRGIANDMTETLDILRKANVKLK